MDDVRSDWSQVIQVALDGGMRDARVVGLELFEQGPDTDFEGPDVRLVWNGAFPDTVPAPGEENYGLGTGPANPYLAGYVVRVHDVDTGALIRTESPKMETEYVYRYDDNKRDGGPRRRLRFTVSIAPKTGPEVGTAQIVVANPRPGLPQGLRVDPTFGGARITYVTPDDTDWTGVIIALGDHADFTPGPHNHVYRGPDTDIGIAIPPGEERHLRVALTDAFGSDDLQWSAVHTVKALRIETQDLAEQIIGDSLLTDALRERIDLIDGPASMDGSVTARLAAEAQARVAAMRAESDARVQAITKEVEARAAAIQAETTARGQAVAAEAQARGTAITEERNARQTQDSALAQRIDMVSAVADGAVSAVQTETQARITEGAANASAINALSAQVNDADTGLPVTYAGLLTEVQTRTNQIGALSTSVEALQVQLNDANFGLVGQVVQERQARIDGDGVNVSAINALSAQVNNANTGLPVTHARLLREEEARTTLAGALTSRVDTLSTTVNGHTAAIQVAGQSIDGLRAAYTVKIDAGGKVIGYGLAAEPNDSGGSIGHFAVRADRFSVSLPNNGVDRKVFTAGTDPITGDPTIVLSGVVYADKIGADQIRVGTISPGVVYAGSISADQIKAGTISADVVYAGSISANQIKVGTISPDVIGDDSLSFTKIKSDLKSNNYAAGVSGWRINKDGSAEFNNVVVSRPLAAKLGTIPYSGGVYYITANQGWRRIATFSIDTGYSVGGWSKTTNRIQEVRAGISNGEVNAWAHSQDYGAYPDWTVKVTEVFAKSRWWQPATLFITVELWAQVYNQTYSLQFPDISYSIFEVT